MTWNESWARSGGLPRNRDRTRCSCRAPRRTAPRQLCRCCPVSTECLADALDNGVEFGVWGGMTERERRALLRRRPERHARGATLLEAARTSPANGTPLSSEPYSELGAERPAASPIAAQPVEVVHVCRERRATATLRTRGCAAGEAEDDPPARARRPARRGRAPAAGRSPPRRRRSSASAPAGVGRRRGLVAVEHQLRHGHPVEHQPGQRHLLLGRAARRSTTPRAARPAPAPPRRGTPCPRPGAARTSPRRARRKPPNIVSSAATKVCTSVSTCAPSTLSRARR